jgi:hypothetical protein
MSSHPPLDRRELVLPGELVGGDCLAGCWADQLLAGHDQMAWDSPWDITMRGALTQRELALENLALRQQLTIWKVRQPRPPLAATDRIFWVVLSRFWKNWRSSLQIARPEMVVRWHRQVSFLKTRPARLTCAFHNCPDYLLRSLASSTRETSWPVAVGASA